jgi:hypothetical protein
MSGESASLQATHPFQFRTLRVRCGGERSRGRRRRSSNQALGTNRESIETEVSRW